MAENSNIEWTDHTFNTHWGCEEVFGADPSLSACLHCYAREQAKRYGFDIWGADKPRRFFGDAHWEEPLKWNNAGLWCDTCGGQKAESPLPTGSHVFRRSRVFCSSMADIFEDYAGPKREEIERQQAAMRAKSKAFANVILGGREEMDAARERLWSLIEQTPNLFWQLLTKRPENMVKMTPERWRNGWPKNVIAMTTVENQRAADERIPQLLKVPAAYRGLSMEPLLGPVNLRNICHQTEHDGYPSFGNFWDYNCENHCTWRGFEGELVEDPEQSLTDAEENGTEWVCPECNCSSGLVERDPDYPRIDWVICGFESGPKKRPAVIDNARNLRDQCQAAGVPFFMKQIDKVQPIPDDLMIREFPEVGQ